MAIEENDEYPGHSRESFTAAAINAVDEAEKAGKLRPREDGPIPLKVDRLEVTVEGPIGEYRIVLKKI
jgi:hypothetical protein